MKIGNKEFEIGKRTYIMGILNATPDSFSDGGKFNTIESALNQVEKMIKEGADIIDIGGESTKPNSEAVGEAEEINRVIPIIKAIRSKYYDIPISVDTYKGRVAELAIEAGANIINDVWGFKKDSYISKVAAKYNVPCCIMHNRENRDYNNFISNVLDDLKESIQIAINAGVKQENIIIDPGIGFAKSYDQNLNLINNVDKLHKLGYPILLATSRKSVIGNTLNLPVEERIEGTVSTTVIGIMKGCSFIRVHDIQENKRAAIMTDAILKRK